MPTDRALIRWVYGDGKSIVEVAALRNVSARALSRHVARLVRRCESREFAFVLARSRSWEAPMARVARACVLEGRTVRAAAQSLNMTIHSVRAIRIVVLSMARGVQQTEMVVAKWRSS